MAISIWPCLVIIKVKDLNLDNDKKGQTMVKGKKIGIFLSILYYSIAIMGALVILFPFIWMLLCSFKTETEMFTIPPTLIPHKFVWENYWKAWTFVPYGRFYLNSVIVSVSVVGGVLLSSSLSAYAFSRIKFFGRDTLFIIYIATLMVPYQVLILPTYLIIRTFGWINTYKALTIPLLANPFGTFLLRQFFLTIPRELEDSAYIDGANRLQTFGTIILPLAKPALAALGIFVFLQSWNNFIWPLVMVSDTNMFTLPLGLTAYQAWYHPEWSMLMAASTSAIIPVLVVFILAQDLFVRGITITGLKG